MDKTPINIIIADDHQLIVESLRSLLIDVKRIKVVGEANNGMMALKLAETLNIDIILMDIEMPVMNGCDATRAIISLYPKIKIIALTSFDEKAVVIKMLNAGASGYLLKNINKETLIEAIETVARGKTYYSSEIDIIVEKPSSEKALSSKHCRPLSNLSTREIEVLKLIALGFSNKDVAEKLYVSPKTIETHRVNIMKKLEIHNLAGLVRYAIENHLLD